ncbi:hypothetical protein Tco_1252789 [Tanacetum coccineum]
MIDDMEFIEKYMLETTLHQQEIQKLLNENKLQMQECKVTLVQTGDVNMVVTQSSGRESTKQPKEFVDSSNENSVSRNENNRSKNKSNESGITSSISGNATKADDADIRPTYNTDSLELVNNDDFNVFSMKKEHPEQPQSVNDTYLHEQGDTNITTNSLDMSTNGEEADQDDDDLTRKCDLLASLIEKLKCEIDESKNHNKLLESSKKTLVDKLKSCYNDNLALMLAPESDETIRLAQESRSKLNLKYFNSLENEIESLQSQLVTQRTQLSNEIDQLSKEYYYADHMNAILGVYTKLDEFTYLQCDYLDQVAKCEHLETELSKSKTQQINKHFANLEQRCIDLELALQHEKKKNVCENSWVKRSLRLGDTEKALKDKIDSLIAELNRKTVETHDLRA